MSLLPSVLALRSGSRYVQFKPKQDIELSSGIVLSDRAYTKFEVVRDSTPGSNRIHIRTCFNNKFWTRNDDSGFIEASVDEPQPDSSKHSCTSFSFRYSNNRVTFSYLGSLSVSAVSGGRLRVGGTSTVSTSFDVIDLIKLVLLPKHVSFKGDNNNYLKSEFIRTRNRLQFGTSSRLDPKAHFESYTEPNGDVRLRSITFDRFWRKSNPEWIWCDNTDKDGRDRDTLFRPVRLSTESKTIGLINLGNNKYCKRRVKRGQPRLLDTLIASASTLVPQAVLEVDEAIRDRTIFDVRYNLELARKYNVQPLFIEPRVVNNNTNETITQRVLYSFRETTSERFKSSHSWKLSAQGKVRIDLIPKLVRGEITWETTYEGNVEWEKTHTESIIKSDGVDVPVPPMTKSVVTVVVERGSIDVPFSYRQRDVLLDGRHVDNEFKDGLFTGVNTYYSTYYVENEPLINSKIMRINEDREEEEKDYDDDYDDDEEENEYKGEEKKRPLMASSRL